MRKYQSQPIVIFTILILIIFTVEAFIMGFLFYLSPPAGLITAVLDATLLSFLLSPLIYHFVAQPLVRYAEDQIEARKQIAQNREFLASVLDSLTHPFHVINSSDYSITMANTASGYADKTGAKCYEVAHNRSTPCTGKDHPCLLRIVKQSGQPAVAEHVHQNGGGEPSLLEIHAFPVFNSEGELKEIIEYSLDRTEYKAALVALRDSEQELRQLHENALEGIFRSRPNGRIIYANLAMARIFGFDSVEDILKINARELYFDIEDRQKLLAEFEAHGKVVHQELRMRDRNGKEIWVRESARVLRDSSGKKRFFEGFLSDITQIKEAEQAIQVALQDLQAAKEYTQLLVASSLDMIIAVDNKRRITEFNDAAEDTFGYTREEVLGKHVNLLYADHKEGNRVHKKTIKHGHQVQEILNRRKNGDTFPCLLSASVLLDSSGKRVGVMGVSRDISKYKQREKVQAAIYQISEAAHTAQKLEQLYGALHEIVGELMPAQNFYIALYNAESGILEFPYFIDEHDQTPAPKKLGKGLTEYVLRTGKPLLSSRDDFDKLVKSGEVERIGTPPIDWLGAPLKAQGRTFGVVAVQSYSSGVRYGEEEQHILKFVSSQVAAAIQRVQAEEVLRESEERYRTVIEASPGSVFLLNRDGNILDLDMPRHLNYRPEVLVTSHIYDLIYEKDQERFEHELKNCTSTGNMCEFEVYSRDQSIIYQVLLAPIKTESQSLNTIVCNLYDISERKRLEADAIRAAKLESIEAFAGGLAHDFNNLLSSIGLNISLARLQVGNDVDMKESLRHAEHSVQMARGISKQLMSFTRGGAPDKVEVDLRPLLEESVKFALGGSRVVPEFNLPENLRVVEIDPSQINQVIHNLAINAAQAMPGGGTLTVSGENVEAGKIKYPSKGTYIKDNYVMITFKDTGDGMPPKILDRIFDPYFTTRKEGSGLGLFSCHTILNQHKGWISAASLSGQGSTFTFCLPAVIGTVDRVPENERFDLGSGRILVMDDEKEIRRVMTNLIEVLGYQVETVTDGKEAVVHYRVAREKDEPFDAVILDLTGTAGMGGLDTVKQLRKLDPHLKAIVSSGHVTHDALQNYEKYGFAGVIHKPCTGEQLSRVLVSVMAESGKNKEVLDSQA